MSPRRQRDARDGSWRAFEEWGEAAQSAAAEAEEELAILEERWSAWLDPLGEISAQDWRRFRPLRLSREEAWTDWFAHLLEQSRTGVLAKSLLHRHRAFASVATYDTVEAGREIRTRARERRADLIVEFGGHAVAHIEVKVGDQSFDKTFHTARLLEDELRAGRTWADFILVPPQDTVAWNAVAERARSSDPREVCLLTWADVAGALRRALREQNESPQWKAWAHSFCGAIEQKLLGCEPRQAREKAASAIRRLACARTQMDVMRRGEQ